ncbi:MAG: SDR family NAD(P)-dependent oxidoreductase, partial [Pirellulaceae bacterium]
MSQVTESLKGRVAVVTGGSYGIGRAIARLLAREGAKVYVGDRQLAEENRGEYAALAIDQWLCDLCDGSQVKAWIDHVIASEGGIDILVNNAGIVLVKQIPETSEAEW